MNLARFRIRLPLAALIAIVSATALASGETHTNYGAIWNDNKPEKGKPFGCLAGSLGRVKGTTAFFSLGLLLRKEGISKSSQTVEVGYTEGALDHKSKLVDGPEMRDVFHACLRPGRYTLLGFQLVQGMTYYNQPREFAIPVEVKAGETTYIGSFIGYLKGDASNCGLPERGTRVEMRDRATEDLPLIQPKAEKAGHALVTAMPDYSSGAPQLLRCPAGAVEQPATQ